MSEENPPDDEPLPEGDEAPPRGVRAMAIVRWALVALMALVAFAALNHRYGWIGGGGSVSDAATTYYCPMHPAVQQDHPGECPICSMTLVPKPKPGEVEAGAAQDAGGVPGLAPLTLSPDRVQLMGMRTAQVARATLAPELRTVGTVVASEQGLAAVQTRFAGWIETLAVEQIGQKIQKGQILATIYSPELLTAQQEYLSARKWAVKPDGGRISDLSAGLGNDARRRLELLGISTPELDEIERTGQPLRAIAVRSPVSGYVTEKNAVAGLAVQPGTPLFQVADLTTVWVIAEVYEHEIGRVAVGQPASIEIASYPGETFTGTLAFVYPALDPATRTLRVRLAFKNPGLRLKPGMYANVNIHLARAEALLVPVEATVDTGVVQYVFVSLPDGKFEPRMVKLGARANGKVEVLEGLTEGETVVTTANFLLDSESHLQAAIRGEGTTGGATPAAGDICATEFDPQKFPAKHQQCVACRVHRGMGSMEEDCRAQIPKPWK